MKEMITSSHGTGIAGVGIKKPNRFRLLLGKYLYHRYLFILFIPTIVLFVVFNYIPMYGVTIAFKDYKFIKGILGSPWIGFENFNLMFSGMSFLSVFRNTVILSFLNLVFGFPAPLILALLINEIRNNKFKKFVQTASYLPYFLSWVILAGIIIPLLSPSVGPVGYLMKAAGLQPISFIGDPSWFRFTLVVTGIWKNAGWGTVVYLASIAGINPELYEAAIVDGAGRFRRTISITLPSLMPVITFLLILNMGSLISDDFDQVFNLYNPAVMQVADVISTYTYRTGLVMMQYSYSAAVGLFRNVIAITLILLSNFILKKVSDNEYGIF